MNNNNNNKSRGLGDSIARFTKATGINTLAQMGAKAMGKKIVVVIKEKTN